MPPSPLARLVPGAPAELARILDPARGPLERPVRAEIFGPERFERHGRSLAETHAAEHRPRLASAFFPRLEENVATLREAHRYMGELSVAGHDISPAGDWLLDNFHLIEAQLAEIRTGLPRGFFRHLPVLVDEPLFGLPRVYGIAWAFVAHTDSAFNQELLHRFLRAYQQTREITFGELWALPTTLRVVLIENLRRLAERAAVNKAAREVANLCCDRLGDGDPATLDPILAALNRRAVGESFLAQVAQHLQDAGQAQDPRQVEWLRQQAPHLAEIQTRQTDAQAADNLSVGNAITALRAIGDADWPALVSDTSVLVQRMLASPLFAAERDDTRDHTLHAIERLARRSGRSEREVADQVVARTEAATRPGTEATGDDAPECSPRHWLLGDGRAALAADLGLDDGARARRRRIGARLVLPLYLGSLGGATVAAVLWFVWRHASSLPAGASLPWITVLAAVLMLFPVSEAVVAVINRLIGESRRPSRLPRLAFESGIPAEHRVLLVVPAMLTKPAAGEELAHRLLLHHLANPEAHAQFALLSDWPDAPTLEAPGDAASLDAARAAIDALNAAHPSPEGLPPRFLLLHRARTWSESEQAWIGRERKRGKLEALVALLADGLDGRSVAPLVSPFLDLGEASRLAPRVPYVVTLDSDTVLPPGRLRELVAVAAHPDNRPRLAADGRRVEQGHAILQPHVATPLPAPESVTRYHWLFAGQPGLDPYSIASSEVYQDVFGEGTFTGKGLLDVKAVHAVLGGRLPAESVLSHDLLEGSIARCAAVTDVPVVEDAPFHADVAASRVHRWTRGDWQLLPLLVDGRFRFGAVNRWKMLDNLRRSLVAPASLALLAVALATNVESPWVVLVLIALAFTAGPLLGLVAAAVPGGDDVARPHYYRQAAADLLRTLCAGVWLIAQLLEMAAASADAIGRALWRMVVSRRRLLQWTTAAAAQASASISLPTLASRHRRTTVAAGVLVALLFALETPWPGLTLALGALWALSPAWIWWVSRPPPAGGSDALSSADRAYLHGVARDTWRLFERCVTAEEHHLPPDNLQVVPDDMVAHRTSPTNIGLYLLSTCCAQRFGWIGGAETVERLEATLATLDRLPRHRGHFLNWYDTARAEPLLPLYVSTVDSGNLCVHLLAVAAAARELAGAPHDLLALEATLAGTARALASHGAADRPSHGPALAALLADAQPLAALHGDLDAFESRLDAAVADHAASPRPERKPDERPTPAERLAWAVDDHLATLHSALHDRRAVLAEASADAAATRTAARLEAIARRCEVLAEEADFAFLHHRQRRLFHIGYRVAEAQLDAGFYDLLASEARATSLWAIAKGDVRPSHWAALGRPFFAAADLAGLRSWSGSMFEYLMPSLVLDEPDGSVLHNAVRAAVQEHMAFGREHSVPWGISESAYAASDHTLAYQYAPQGVPRLALRRTPADELVVAPYATVLAAQALPHRAANNLRRLERLAGRGRYGFVEALDYTRARQSADEGVTRVQTFMAHHQGMSIVALANVLLERTPRRWGMRDARIEAVASLLHERAPREVPNLHEPVAPTTAGARARRAPGVLRETTPGVAALPPTHLLSNGRYAVALRPDGAGTSRWRKLAVHRERDDALRDDCGWFCYLRWDRSPEPTSLTQHPAPDRAAHYTSTFHLDRATFGATWSEVDAQSTVWVSPEDDLEFRRVVLTNTSDRELDLELFSAFEVTLADPRADESHPAFQNLFVQAEWRPTHQALVFHRQPRLATDAGVHAAHFVAAADPPGQGVRVQVDRAAWRGRNRPSERPLAALADAPQAGDARGAPLDTGLDPVAALSVRMRIAPGSKATVTFAAAVAGDEATLAAVVDKHRQAHHVERASTMSSTLAAIRLRETRLNAETFLAVQSLTTLLVQTPTRLQAAPRESGDAVDRRLLWRFGISGDRPIVLVSAGAIEGGTLLRSLSQALRIWSWGGVAMDLVVTNHEPASYVMALSRSLTELREAHVASQRAEPGAAEASFHLLQASDLHPDELSTLRALARVRLNADGRPLVHHVQELEELHERALVERQAVLVAALPHAMATEVAARRPQGEFAETSGEFRFDVSALQRPARPWVNVMANPGFGAQLSEAGGGHSWGGNSRLNMLTPWSNDPIADPAGEWFLLQDTKTRGVWSVTPSAAGDPEADYRVAHGQGSSMVSHRRGNLDIAATWCVDPVLAVKQVRIRLVNRGHRTASVRAIGVAEWIVGAQRSDRGTTATRAVPGAAVTGSAAHAPSASSAFSGEPTRRRTTLFCTQRDRSAGFGGGTAFLALVTEGASAPTDDEDLDDWTTDRRELFDARGRPVVPDQFGRVAGIGLDPCAALATRLVVRAGETRDAVFLLGYAPSPQAAEALAEEAARVPPLGRLQSVRAHWDALLDAQVVKTPDPLFDRFVNRWLLYQTLSCRLDARAGFYQAGGAYGYRDQLQDTLGLAWTAPERLRQQILLSASRQFPEGDVQHWWHAPTGAGVRTHFSDDLLWLPFAAAHYVETTGDASVLDEAVPFLEGAPIPAGAEDAYYAPATSEREASVYEHAARAIDKSLTHGAHDLPLMGTGDWNDGMNRVGHEGRGESVWLGWFLLTVVDRFAPIAEARSDGDRAGRWRAARERWQRALNDAGWDGAWFRRAFFDDGSPLGTAANAECRVDLIAQAWSVLSGGTTDERQRLAMAAVETHLLDDDAGVVRLLDPPLAQDRPSAGYIQSYPPGVRENGGQYSHAGIWAVLAFAARGDADAAWRAFRYLSPPHRSRDPKQGPVYGIEPYVMPGDVYTAPPYVGRGGWSWYTGSASWMHRAAIEGLLGFRRRGDLVSFEPCLPPDWPTAELALTRDGRTVRIVLARAPASAPAGARPLAVGAPFSWSETPSGTVCHVALPASEPAASYDGSRAVPIRPTAGAS